MSSFKLFDFLGLLHNATRESKKICIIKKSFLIHFFKPYRKYRLFLDNISLLLFDFPRAGVMQQNYSKN